MLVSGIKSRPVYEMLRPNLAARHNLFAAEGDGAKAVLDLASSAPVDFMARSTIFYVPGAPRVRENIEALQALAPQTYLEAPTVKALLSRFNALLLSARMGTQLYLTGTEGFIGQLTQVAMDAGISHRSIQAEHRGSWVRQVQCVHCKGITEGVTSNIVACGHCGKHLLVRDHYSRRIGAFMGVMVDAEEPGVMPKVEEVFA